MCSVCSVAGGLGWLERFYYLLLPGGGPPVSGRNKFLNDYLVIMAFSIYVFSTNAFYLFCLGLF